MSRRTIDWCFTGQICKKQVLIQGFVFYVVYKASDDRCCQARAPRWLKTLNDSYNARLHQQKKNETTRIRSGTARSNFYMLTKPGSFQFSRSVPKRSILKALMVLLRKRTEKNRFRTHFSPCSVTFSLFSLSNV